MTFTNAGKITPVYHFYFIYSFLVTEKQIQVFFKAETRQKHGLPLSLIHTRQRIQYQSNLICEMYLFPNFWFDSYIHLGKSPAKKGKRLFWEGPSRKPTCKMIGQTLCLSHSKWSNQNCYSQLSQLVTPWGFLLVHGATLSSTYHKYYGSVVANHKCNYIVITWLLIVISIAMDSILMVANFFFFFIQIQRSISFLKSDNNPKVMPTLIRR